MLAVKKPDGTYIHGLKGITKYQCEDAAQVDIDIYCNASIDPLTGRPTLHDSDFNIVDYPVEDSA